MPLSSTSLLDWPGLYARPFFCPIASHSQSQTLKLAKNGDTREGMWEILLKTLPFFAVIGLGYWAGATRFFNQEATAYLTKFVFYFALSAMIFRFTSNLTLAEIWDQNLVLGYFLATAAVYVLVVIVALARRQGLAVAAVEAQCATMGNVGFLGIPMLTLLLGPAAIGPIVMAVSIDLAVFSSVIVILVPWAYLEFGGRKRG